MMKDLAHRTNIALHDGRERFTLGILFAFLTRSLALAFFLTLGACTQKNKQKVEEDVFRVIITDIPESIDWNKSNVIDGVKELLSEPLLTYKFQSTSTLPTLPVLAPALAKKWRMLDGGRTWEIDLRDDVFWSDGSPLQASHVRDSVERFLHPDTRAFLASTLYVVRGAKKFNTGEVKGFSQVGVSISKTSPLTLRFELERPATYFAHLLTMTSLGPIRKDLIDKHGGDDHWLKPEKFVGLGPYLIEKYQPQEFLKLRANPKYYAGVREVQKIEGLYVAEASAGVNLFESGYAHLTFSLPSEEIERFKKRKDYFEAAGTSPGFLGFDFDSPVSKNTFLRQAISLALDRREIAKVFAAVRPEKFILAQAFGVMPPQDVYSEKDLALAKEKLRQAQLPKDFKLQLHVRSSSNLVKAAENIQFQLKSKLGLHVELQTLERSTLRGQILARKIPFFLYVMGPDYLDPHSIMEFYTSKSSQNILGWKSQAYDKLVLQAEREADDRSRYALYKKANLILTEDAFYIPLFSYSYPYLLSEKYTGFQMPPIYRIELRDLKKVNKK
jgi:oligopeptide transport system substrate-binding protein